jgi:hypothetical protein
LAERHPLPWLYPYREDPQHTRLGQPVFRPFVPVSLAIAGASTPELEGLVDTGADGVLASDLLADALGSTSPRTRAKSDTPSAAEP